MERSNVSPNSEISLQNGEIVSVTCGIFRRFAIVDFTKPDAQKVLNNNGVLKLHYFANAGTGFVRPDSTIWVDLSHYSSDLDEISIRHKTPEHSYPYAILELDKLSKEQIEDLEASGYLKK